MLFKPGRYVKIRHRQSEAVADASILKASESELNLLVLTDMLLYPGDEIELEIYQREDTFYFCRASVIEVSGNRVNVMQERPGLCRPQHRKSERMPANLKIEYALLSKNLAAHHQEGLLRDISRHGALIYVKDPLPLGEELLLTLEFDLTGEDETITTNVQGKVIRQHSCAKKGSDSWKYSYGMEFKKPLPTII